MTKLAKCMVALGLLVVLLLLLAFFLFIQPYIMAQNSMPESAVLIISEQEDGSLMVSWPSAEEADSYLMEITDTDGNVLYSKHHVATSCTLPEFNTDGPVKITINSERDYKTVLSSKVRMGDDPLEVTCSLSAPSFGELTSNIDIDGKMVSFNWSSVDGDIYDVCYYYNDGEVTELKQVEGAGNATVTFGDNCDLDMLRLDETVSFVFYAHRHGENYEFNSRGYESVSVVRDDLLGTNLNLQLTDEGDNFYTLTWGETRGDRYEVQQEVMLGVWKTLAEYGIYDELTFSTGHLKPFTDYKLRVVAYGSETIEDSEFSAYPDEVSFTTGASAIYATVWPLVELDIYSDESKTETIAKAPAATAYCVADEVDGLFKIYTADGYGYIDSNYCMINLPDYIGNLVSYDIKNSYSAIYMVHEYGIPEITGTVITGYEDVLTSTGYLVPLLYPTAQKLVDAALSVQEDGMRLKIYDSFRPRKATRFLYDQTLSILYNALPESIFAEMDHVPWIDGEEETEDIPDETQQEEELSTVFESAISGEGAEENLIDENLEEIVESRMSYYTLMTNGTYALGHFLARVGSYHNMGIAVDLTLEYSVSHEELEMQTSMHDLSWYSAVNQNNANANMLAKYMTSAGFGTLSSEWWHFQDNDIKSELGLTSYLEVGVSVEGWKVDDLGVRYRLYDGTYYKSCTVSIGSTAYTFDDDGYLKQN